MKTPKQLPASAGSDPVAASIQRHLQSEAAHGHGTLRMNDETQGVRVTFDQVTVRAENYDIAFVRLANALLDDQRLSSGLITALREPFAAERSRHDRLLHLLS